MRPSPAVKGVVVDHVRFEAGPGVYGDFTKHNTTQYSHVTTHGGVGAGRLVIATSFTTTAFTTLQNTHLLILTATSFTTLKPRT